MITLILGIMALLSIGLIAIMAVAIGWWLIPVVICCLLIRSILKTAGKLFRKKDDVITMSRKEFEANYVRRSGPTTQA